MSCPTETAGRKGLSCNYQPRTWRRSRGFTLLEVLIALAVLAIAMAAVVKVATNQSAGSAHLKEKTLAHWVALNQIAELQLAREWPSEGKKWTTEELGGHKWHCQTIVTKTPDERVRQVRVKVYREREDNSSITQLASFLAMPK